MMLFEHEHHDPIAQALDKWSECASTEIQGKEMSKMILCMVSYLAAMMIE